MFKLTGTEMVTNVGHILAHLHRKRVHVDDANVLGLVMKLMPTRTHDVPVDDVRQALSALRWRPL